MAMTIWKAEFSEAAKLLKRMSVKPSTRTCHGSNTLHWEAPKSPLPECPELALQTLWMWLEPDIAEISCVSGNYLRDHTRTQKRNPFLLQCPFCACYRQSLTLCQPSRENCLQVQLHCHREGYELWICNGCCHLATPTINYRVWLSAISALWLQ